MGHTDLLVALFGGLGTPSSTSPASSCEHLSVTDTDSTTPSMATACREQKWSSLSHR